MYSLDRSIIEACNARLRDGSRTFLAASYLLPRKVREPAAALYAFCRVADDAVDQEIRGEENLTRLRERLSAIYAGHPENTPEDRGFACVVRHFGIPRALPEALLEGFEWDIKQRRYEELDELHAYSARVAGTVGAMMAMIMGVREPAVIARACELGMAMQLSNIARDIGEDGRNARLYLPRQWLREVGIDPDAWLQDPVYSPALGQVVQRLLRVADELYRSADPGIGMLPISCRVGIRSARLIYSEIGREVERHNLDSVSRRAVVPAVSKLNLIGRAFSPERSALDAERPPMLESSKFLVNAVAAAPPPENDVPFVLPASWWQFNKQAAWTLDLFERLEEREQISRTRSAYLQSGLRSRIDG